jgi:Flp pilus assembly protein TadG
VIVVVALLIPVLLGLAAFAVDLGYWYWQQRELQGAADSAALAGARDLPSDPNSAYTDARTYAARNVSGATVTPVTGYGGDPSTVQVTVSKLGPLFFASVLGIGSPTITATAVAKNFQTTSDGSFFYAGSTACDAITITDGGDDFTKGQIWSNGGVNVSGATDTAGKIFVGNPSCPFPSQLTPPGATNVTARTTWPQPLPSTPASCSTSPINIDANWLSANPPGVYCTTGSVSVGVGNTTISGYEFVSESSQANAISVTQGGDTFIGYGNPSTIFYATQGGITVNNPTTMNGAMFAPYGPVVFNGGSEGETGFMEADTITLNNGSNSFTGTGPLPNGASNIALIG